MSSRIEPETAKRIEGWWCQKIEKIELFILGKVPLGPSVGMNKGTPRLVLFIVTDSVLQFRDTFLSRLILHGDIIRGAHVSQRRVYLDKPPSLQVKFSDTTGSGE